MKTETLLLIAGAVGVGYLLHKQKSAAQPSIAAVTPTARIATAIPDEDADIVFVEPAYPYPVPGWGPSWGNYRGRGGWGGGHRGGHHGRGGMHGFHGRRR